MINGRMRRNRRKLFVKYYTEPRLNWTSSLSQRSLVKIFKGQRSLWWNNSKSSEKLQRPINLKNKVKVTCNPRCQTKCYRSTLHLKWNRVMKKQKMEIRGPSKCSAGLELMYLAYFTPLLMLCCIRKMHWQISCSLASLDSVMDPVD